MEFHRLSWYNRNLSTVKLGTLANTYDWLGRNQSPCYIRLASTVKLVLVLGWRAVMATVCSVNFELLFR